MTQAEVFVVKFETAAIWSAAGDIRDPADPCSVAGIAAPHMLMPISAVVIVVLAIVVTSHRQTIYAYPNGGGAYIVARDNLGRSPSLVAGASLLVDYTLTVAVSVSAGVAAVVSAYPSLREHRVSIALLVVAFMTLANLRGAKESGALFAVPTYLCIIALGLLIGVGLWRMWFGDLELLPVDRQQLTELRAARLWGWRAWAVH